MTDEKKKKCFLAAIWKSMIKTGGRCGSEEDCCDPSQQEKGPDTGQEKKEDIR